MPRAFSFFTRYRTLSDKKPWKRGCNNLFSRNRFRYDVMYVVSTTDNMTYSRDIFSIAKYNKYVYTPTTSFTGPLPSLFLRIGNEVDKIYFM